MSKIKGGNACITKQCMMQGNPRHIAGDWFLLVVDNVSFYDFKVGSCVLPR